MSNSPATSMSDEFRCPVCRARQTLQPECRRCHADLTLVVKARHRAEHLFVALQQAREDRDFAAQHQLAKELRLLHPGLLRQEHRQG